MAITKKSLISSKPSLKSTKSPSTLEGPAASGKLVAASDGKFRVASLRVASLKSASLKSASLKSASLKSASLKSASLKSASLKAGSLKY